jgi:nitrate reductase NapE component
MNAAPRSDGAREDVAADDLRKREPEDLRDGAGDGVGEELPGAETREAVAAAFGARRPALAQLAEQARGGRALPPIVAGALSWALTVAPVGFGRGRGALSMLAATVALAAALSGPLLLARRPRISRHVGISIFAFASLAAWLANSAALHPLRLEPSRGAFGAIAWGVFAVSWSDRWGAASRAAAPEREWAQLSARATLAPLSAPIVAIGVAAGLGYIVFAFQVRDPDRALLAQAAALLAGVVVASAAATVATARGKPRSMGGRRITPAVIHALLLLGLLLVVGAIVVVLR